MATIRSNAEQILREDYRKYEKDNMSLAEYTEREAEGDPNFFRWLFNEELDSDFDSSLTIEHKKIYASFLAHLKDSK